MNLSAELDIVQQLANGSRLNRLLHNPYKYISALLIAKILYRRKGLVKKTNTFFREELSVLLPASTDIYLTGGKTHESEIRLARFLLNTIDSKDIIIDVGAHFGYYTLLFSKLARTGHVYAFEPSVINFGILALNAHKDNISIYNRAVSDKEGKIPFYEFPALFSENNSIYASQYQDESWFKNSPVKKTTVDSVTLDNFCATNNIQPGFIKIDVEGAEYDVIKGGLSVIKQTCPVIAMEFLCRARKNESHHLAKKVLSGLGYKSYRINEDGSLAETGDIEGYLQQKNIESDNIIFLHNTNKT
jgi:FkbM family methyltransferase